MADINKEDVKLFSSQRLDDTEQGGGAMTFTEIVDGSVNNLFPDISRMDRVYGRVSLRKAFLAVVTSARETYYGSHAVITQQAADPLVGVTFFTTKDWFDTREEAKDRVESYLGKGSIFGVALYGNHYLGGRNLRFFTGEDGPEPTVGEVMVLTTDRDLDGVSIPEVSQFVRVTEVSAEIKTFVVGDDDKSVKKKVLDVSIGSPLVSDFPGTDVSAKTAYTYLTTKVYTSVVADSAKYYGISPLKEDVSTGSLSIRAENITVSLVPSAQSETGIVDSGVGGTINPAIQPQDEHTTVTRTFSGNLEPANSFTVGEGIYPGSLSCTSLSLTDNFKGDVLQSGAVIGSVEYNTGTITWSTDAPGGNFTAAFTYVPSAPPTMYSEADGLYIDVQNRGYVYTFFCEPVPERGTLRVDFLSGGKWYSLRDLGNGEMKGSDPSIGSGTLNFATGSVSVSLGALPDADSMLLFFWAIPKKYYDLSGETLPFKYEFTLQHQGIAVSTFSLTWNDGTDDHQVTDDGAGGLDYELVGGPGPVTGIGSINYTTGEVAIDNLPVTPVHSQNFNVAYNQGDPEVEEFVDPVYTDVNRMEIGLSNISAIVPGSIRIEWVNKLQYYRQDATGGAAGTYKTFSAGEKERLFAFEDDGAGGLEENGPNTMDGWSAAVVTYTAGAGQVAFSPDRIEDALTKVNYYRMIGGGYTT